MIKHVGAAVREGEPVPEAVLVGEADHVRDPVAVLDAVPVAEAEAVRRELAEAEAVRMELAEAEAVPRELPVAVAEHVARFTEEPAGHSEGQPQGVGAPAPVGQKLPAGH